jgi:hypothetical protein
MEPSVAIYFILDGKEFAFRRWRFVPAVGDKIEFDGQRGRFFTIERRCWVQGDSALGWAYQQAVNIWISEIDTKAKRIKVQRTKP